MSFTAFNPEDSVISSDATVNPMWLNDTTTLPFFYLDPNQQTSDSGKFYLDVYGLDPLATSNTPVQFSIAYGQANGSGSVYFNQFVPNKTPTRDIYGQFRSLIYGDENTSFTFNSTKTSDEIIVFSINRAQFKESVYPGSLTLRITSGSNSIVLTDDSTVSSTSTYVGTSRVYQLLSGSSNNVSSSNYTVSGSYGLLIPDEGLIILNPKALRLPPGPLGGLEASFYTGSSDDIINDYGGVPNFNINNQMVIDMLNDQSAGLPPTFSLQNYETIASRYFFVRVKNSEYNYTTNPTVIDNNGNLLFTQLIYSPQTFITTVGMYNNAGDLVAIAKLNKPLVKDFTKELLLRVKLDF